jgi:hypothetical protein
MKKIILLAVLIHAAFRVNAALPDSLQEDKISVLVIPYNPSMHLSDSDPHIAEGSELPMNKMRAELRENLIKSLNKNFEEVYDVRSESRDFVQHDNRDMDVVYHTLRFETDSVYTLKYPAKFAVKDTVKKSGHVKKESQYMNIGIYDEMLIPDLSEKYNADYFIFLNELEIKTHFDDCLNLALKIYRRDLMVHYSIFDKKGKQVYGDVAVSHFDSNSNDVKEISSKNFPQISKYILASLDKVSK